MVGSDCTKWLLRAQAVNWEWGKNAEMEGSTDKVVKPSEHLLIR